MTEFELFESNGYEYSGKGMEKQFFDSGMWVRVIREFDGFSCECHVAIKHNGALFDGVINLFMRDTAQEMIEEIEEFAKRMKI